MYIYIYIYIYQTNIDTSAIWLSGTGRQREDIVKYQKEITQGNDIENTKYFFTSLRAIKKQGNHAAKFPAIRWQINCVGDGNSIEFERCVGCMKA